MTIEVALTGAARFPELSPKALRSWLEALATELAPRHDSLGVRFAGDRTMRALNRDFRGKDKSTDVLSFPGEPTPDGRHLGDIVISVPTAARQAEERGHALEREVKLLLLHGVLHCLGHDHERDGGEMERLESALRRRWLRR
jgi:probable rRNA maturation factor